MKIGLPRALLHYRFGAMWETFFARLGIETVLSGHTTADIVARGTAAAVDECCLPLKVWLGHVGSLIGRCDMVLAPRFVGPARDEEYCVRFLGLPDILRHTFPNARVVTYDHHSYSRAKALAEMMRLGEALSKDLVPHMSPMKICAAYGAGIQAQQAADAAGVVRQNRFLSEGYPGEGYPGEGYPGEGYPGEGYSDESHPGEGYPGEGRPTEGDLCEIHPSDMPPRHDSPHRYPVKALLVAQPYIIHDAFMGGPLLRMLREAGAVPVFPDLCDRKACAARAGELSKDLYWTMNREAIGAIPWLRDRIDGVLLVSAFPCGTDSLVNELVLRRVTGIPVTQIILDEQQGEAGLHTRVECFVDILKDGRRRHA